MPTNGRLFFLFPEGVGVTLDNDLMTIAEHAMPIRYGALLATAVDVVIVPSIDSYAANLGQMFDNAINCSSIGWRIAGKVGFGTIEFYTAACELAVQASANLALAKLRGIDASAPVTFRMTGNTRIRDDNGDLAPDALMEGRWSGAIEAGGTGTLLSSSTFFGTRLGN